MAKKNANCIPCVHYFKFEPPAVFSTTTNAVSPSSAAVSYKGCIFFKHVILGANNASSSEVDGTFSSSCVARLEYSITSIKKHGDQMWMWGGNNFFIYLLISIQMDLLAHQVVM